MATTKIETFLQEGVWITEWSEVETGEEGDETNLSKWPNKTVHISGTVGTNGVVTIEGSNDGTNWAPLSSGLGSQGDLAAIVIPATGVAVIRAIYENTKWIRPTVAGTNSSAKIIILAS